MPATSWGAQTGPLEEQAARRAQGCARLWDLPILGLPGALGSQREAQTYARPPPCAAQPARFTGSVHTAGWPAPSPPPQTLSLLLLRDPSPLLPSLGTPSGQGDGVAALTWCRAGVRMAGHPRRTLTSVLRVSLSLHLEARPPPGPQPCPGPGPPQASLHLEAVPPVCGRACVTQSRDETRKRGRGRTSRSFLASPFPTAEGAWRGPPLQAPSPFPSGPGAQGPAPPGGLAHSSRL